MTPPTNTLAHRVIAAASQCNAAYSLYAGYGIIAPGQYVHFPQGVQLSEKRNADGRVINALYVYADGSKIRFTYSNSRGSRLEQVWQV